MKYFYLLIICFIVSNFLQAQDFAFNHLDHDSRYNSIVSLFSAISLFPSTIIRSRFAFINID